MWSDDPITKRNISNLINKITNNKLITNYKVIFTLSSKNVFKLVAISD